jgi:glucose-1-phosphatase
MGPQSMAEPVMPHIRAVLFDIGGVVVQLNDITVLGSFNGRTDAAGILAQWLDCPHVRAHESGKIDGAEFAHRMVKTYAIGCTPEAFLERCIAWHGELFPGVRETLSALKPEIKLACLSNTSTFAWTTAPCCIDAAKLFDIQILSHELGVMKPDPEIYRIAAERMDEAPERILFFDDTERNVAAAKALGFHAHCVLGFEPARRILEDYGLLSSSSAGSSHTSPS